MDVPNRRSTRRRLPRSHVTISISDALGRALLDLETGRRPQAYSSEYSPLFAFLEARTRRAFGARTQSAVLHQEYLEWSPKNGCAYMTNNMLTRRLKELGLRTIQSNKIFWVDLELLPKATGNSTDGA
jgi:hypothetical protein